jgi:hypothetical protein
VYRRRLEPAGCFRFPANTVSIRLQHSPCAHVTYVSGPGSALCFSLLNVGSECNCGRLRRFSRLILTRVTELDVQSLLMQL